MRCQRLFRHSAITLLAFAIMGFFAAVTVSIKSLNPLTEAVSKFSFTDLYYSILRTGRAPEESRVISIVDIYQFLGRGNYAKLLEDLESMHPKVICVDAVFEGMKPEDMEGDMALAEVVEKYDNIVFSMKMEELHEEGGLWVSTEQIRSFFTEFTDVKEGFCNMPRGNLYDEMKREIHTSAQVVVPAGDTLKYSSMVVETANLYAGCDIIKGSDDVININYSPTHFPKMKPDEVLKHPEWVEGRIVYLGDLHDAVDQHWSPTGEKLPGVEILAYGTQTLLDKKEVINPHIAITCLLSFFWVLLMRCVLSFYSYYTKQSSRLVVKYIVGSSYGHSILVFIFTYGLLYISFVVFSKWNVSLNWGWALSGFAFLGTGENLYDAVNDYVTALIERRRSKLQEVNA